MSILGLLLLIVLIPVLILAARSRAAGIEADKQIAEFRARGEPGTLTELEL